MFEIDGHPIGAGHPVYVVAEIGVNHGGSIEKAFRLINAAKRAGADCCKFQTWNTRRLLSPDHPMYSRLLPLELSEGQFRAIKQHCDDAGITFLSTPDQAEDADMLEALGVPAFKVGSGNLRDLAFLGHVAAKKVPVVLSTGMGDFSAILDALEAINRAGNNSVALLHCASVYAKGEDGYGRMPDPEPWNLRAIESLKSFGYPVGYSDHSRMTAAAVAAVTLGASIYEAHIKMDNDCIDAGVSLHAEDFGWLVNMIRWTEVALGDGKKRCMEAEKECKAYTEAWLR